MHLEVPYLREIPILLVLTLLICKIEIISSLVIYVYDFEAIEPLKFNLFVENLTDSLGLRLPF